MTSQLFVQASEIGSAKQPKTFGHPYNGRYHMPLLPGEEGVKSGGDWVPYGCTRMTNISGGVEDTRALSVWEQAMGLIGLALAPELYEELTLVVAAALSEGVDFERLRDYPALKETLAGHAHDQRKAAESIIGRAKVIAKAGAAAQRGTNRHTAWEHRGKTGQLIGTAQIQEQTISTEALLADVGLVRVPDLSERVVRNLELGAVGKFDDILLELSTGRLLISDLKTKATAFYSFLAVDAQLAGYARAEWMLTLDGRDYEPGPLLHVDQSEGVILHVPSDGGTPRLERADLELGWRAALLGRDVMALRGQGKNAERMSRSAWVPGQAKES